MKEKNHEIISIDEEKAFDKTNFFFFFSEGDGGETVEDQLSSVQSLSHV